ncbi:MAG TPA: hypothetical protein VD862_04560 [Candidatus Paceibacterota bacterium]|nr:hypothetical protein [Candidatus Paceibacterota bacterium]
MDPKDTEPFPLSPEPGRSVIRHGSGDITSIEEKTEDEFVRYDERMKLWGWLSREFGAKWEMMSQQQREATVQKYIVTIIEELKAMAGGLWDQLSPENKRELFHARFIDRTAPPVPVRPAKPPVRKAGPEGKTEHRATGFVDWVARNAGRLPADWGERRKMYLEETGGE